MKVGIITCMTCMFAVALTVGGPIKSLAFRSEKTVPIGGNVTLLCPIVPDDIWKSVYWKKNDNTIYSLEVKSNTSWTNSTRYEGSNHATRLTIKDLKKSDSGIYHCAVVTLISIIERGHVLLSVTDQKVGLSTTSSSVPVRACTTIPPQHAEDNTALLVFVPILIIFIPVCYVVMYRKQIKASGIVGACTSKRLIPRRTATPLVCENKEEDIGLHTRLLGPDTGDRDGVNSRPEGVFDDLIHGSIQMPKYCQIIIDTPEFQRLRFIKQLGCTNYVFPSAVHTRFEHSIGVSHLGGKLASMLQQSDRNSSTPILNTEVACVEIACLCHDLGHGPFSHAFEDIIQPYEDGKKWKADKQAVFMFKYLIKHNSLEKKLEEHNIYAEDIDFICQLILGVKEDEETLRENKFCLYQLVNNSVNGMDVDRWDYIARGTHYLGRKFPFDFNRILPFVKVLDVKRGSKTRRELCFKDKVASDLNQMFLTSRHLNYASYQDRHSEIIAIMLKDAFQEAADHLVFVGEGGKKYKLLDSVKDPKAFCQVDDTIVNAIRQSLSQEPGMVKAREIIDRIHRREFYHCISECKNAKEEMGTMDPAEIKREILTDVDELSSSSSSSYSEIWQAHNIEVISVKLSRFDCGGRNPLINIPFYKKSSDGKFVAEFLPVDEISRLLGETPGKKLPADLPPVDVSFRIYTKVPKLDRETLNMAKSRCETRLEMIPGRQRSVPTKPVKQKVKSPPIEPVAPSPPLSAVGHVTSPSSGSGSSVSTDGDEGIPSLMSNPPDAVSAVGTGPAESNPRGSRSPEVKLH